ncbi:HAMP domain-containing sensor histidine kinase [Sulfurimonas sp.]|uniref:sensor histidine kinase n=1 Tax=Sulfurimonas sp. TaxID=2022749 RepID=UPI0025E78D34|nr:HAMP domain-containing sensor histidine kinase [Sulfurimonas sp.]
MTENRVLKRQLKKAGIDSFSSLNEITFKKLLKEVEQSYKDNTDTRRIMEHSLDVSSQEMQEIVCDLEKAHKDAEKKDKLIFQQSRFAQMGEIISMIAHQWRQPLNIISITTASIQFDILLDKIEKDKIIDSMNSIANKTQHLSDTIDDFRNFFKPTKEMTVTTFSDEINSALNIIGKSITIKNVKIIKDLKCISEFSVYANELKHVIINIIKNSEDVLIEKKIKDPYIKISSYKQDNNGVLQISDNGGGILKDNIEKIFDPYFSTKSKKSGTGLGLYMSKIIIEEHCSGRLEVSQNSDGAVFKIFLPH